MKEFDPKAEYGFSVEWAVRDETDLSALGRAEKVETRIFEPMTRHLVPLRRMSCLPVFVAEGDADAVRSIRDWLIADAGRVLPPGTSFEIREKQPHDYGRSRGLAWYYDPLRPKDAPLTLVVEPFFDPARGVIFHGTYFVPPLEAEKV